MKTKRQLSLEQRVLRLIQEQQLIAKQQKLVVAVSGGQDSVCLLHILLHLQQELGIKLHVAHLNHQLRGVASEADARYVANLAQKLDVPATIEQRDVKAYQEKKHLSLEEAAREVRYHFLAQVCQAVGTERAAVGHTVDDHAETILMHLIRGSGTRGLRGLQPLSRWQSSGHHLNVIRPLLEISRNETAAYCKQHQLKPRLDVSNLSLSPLRNRIRLELLPLLQKYNPQVVDALLRTARIATDELAFLDQEVKRIRGEVSQKHEGTLILNKEMFQKLPPALQRHLLRSSIEELAGNLKDIEARHIEELMEVLDKPAGKRICLPEGLTFSIEYDRYLLGSDPAALSPFPTLDGEYDFKIPGETLLPGWRITATITNREQTTEEKSDFIAYFDLEKVGNKVTVRRRKPGDRFQPLGMSQPKKLNEFMIDAKIPQSWRQRIPIVCSSSQILWVVGWRIDERVKVSDTSQKVLMLKMERTTGG